MMFSTVSFKSFFILNPWSKQNPALIKSYFLTPNVSIMGNVTSFFLDEDFVKTFIKFICWIFSFHCWDQYTNKSLFFPLSSQIIPLLELSSLAISIHFINKCANTDLEPKQRKSSRTASCSLTISNNLNIFLELPNNRDKKHFDKLSFISDDHLGMYS